MTLPLVFVVGDSISLGYGPYLKQQLEGVCRYDRKSGEEQALQNLDLPVGANGGDSPRVLRYLKGMLADPGWRPDYLLVNCGLHDLKYQDGSWQVPLAEYQANLAAMVALTKQADLRLLWIRTTPVNMELHRRRKPFDRREQDVHAYNQAADQIMRQAAVPLVDLFTMTNNLGVDEAITNDGVHFVADVQCRQAAYIAGWLNAYLQC